MVALGPSSYHFVIFTRYQALNVWNKLDELKCPDPRKLAANQLRVAFNVKPLEN